MSKYLSANLLLLYLVFGALSTFGLSPKRRLQKFTVDFSKKLLKNTFTENKEDNIAISPFFIGRDLAVLLSAGKDSFKKLPKILGVSDVKPQQLRSLFGKFPKEVQIKETLYYSNKTKEPLIVPFLLGVAGSIAGEAAYDYVTKHHIWPFAKRLPNEKNVFNKDSLVLKNNIQLEAEWKKPFPSSNSRLQTFFNFGYEPIKVSAMHDIRKVKFGSFPGAKVIELPFRNSKTKMTIILPTGPLASILGAGFRYIKSAVKSTTNAIINVLKRTEIVIPHFTINFTSILATSLKNDSDARLISLNGKSPNAFPKKLQKKAAFLYHQTSLNFNPFGVGVNIAKQSNNDQEPLNKDQVPLNNDQEPPEEEFIVDRPFLYVLHQNGVIYLMGQVTTLKPAEDI